MKDAPPGQDENYMYVLQRSGGRDLMRRTVGTYKYKDSHCQCGYRTANACTVRVLVALYLVRGRDKLDSAVTVTALVKEGPVI